MSQHSCDIPESTKVRRTTINRKCTKQPSTEDAPNNHQPHSSYRSQNVMRIIVTTSSCTHLQSPYITVTTSSCTHLQSPHIIVTTPSCTNLQSPHITVTTSNCTNFQSPHIIVTTSSCTNLQSPHIPRLCFLTSSLDSKHSAVGVQSLHVCSTKCTIWAYTTCVQHKPFGPVYSHRFRITVYDLRRKVTAHEYTLRFTIFTRSTVSDLR